MTESEVLNMLRQRFIKAGNGGAGEYAFMTGVRNRAGFDATRTFDAVTVGLWPSRGFRIHAYEVKCSRSDWLRELKNPEKAEAAAALCDHFSVVASGPDIVAEGELPPTWGLLVARGSKLVCVKDAPLLPGADPKRPVPRSFLVPMLRAGGAVPKAEAEEIAQARREGRAAAAEAMDAMLEAARAEHQDLFAKVRAFEQAAGVALTGWNATMEPVEVGRRLRSIIQGEKQVDQTEQRIRNARQSLLVAACELARLLPAEATAEVASNGT